MPGPASTSPITLDPSDWGYVIVCTEHPYWSALRFTKVDALECAARHEHDWHPNDSRIRDRLYDATRRGRVAAANPALTPEVGASV